MAIVEEELQIVRRAFPVAQALLAGGVSRLVTDSEDVSWFGPDVGVEPGATAAVRSDGAHADLVGEVLLVTAGVTAASVLVYVVGTADTILTDLAIARRAFLSVSPLHVGLLNARIEVVGG